MADIFNRETRSYVMRQVKSRDTKPELQVRSFLHQQGFRFRLCDKKLPGSPDIVLKKYNTVIFVHGCFWHGHEKCKRASIPKTNTEWWKYKLQKNKKNDRKASKQLMKSGWKVLTIWNCENKNLWEKRLLNSLIN